jgi:hypothetical protein
MPATIEERFDSRQGTDGEDPTTELIYMVSGTEDDNEVRSLVASTSPTDYTGLVRDRFSIEHLGGGVWECKVQYVKLTSEAQYAFDTGGGTQHITQSLANVQRRAAPGFVAPNYFGAIGVSEVRVEGTDIAVPVFNFTETHRIANSVVTASYKLGLFRLTGKVNDNTFKGFARGEVLFLGASGSKSGFDHWEITFRFAASPNVSNLTIGDITNINKEGWHYLWVRFADDVDNTAKALIKRPIAAYVEQVYFYGDFSNLGIGV